MNYAGISHFADQRDCFYLENGKLRIRLMTAKNDISSIYLHIPGQVYFGGTNDLDIALK